MGRRPEVGRRARTGAERQHKYWAKKHPSKTVLKQQRRAKREQELAAATIATWERLGTKVFSVLLCDFPWDFVTWSRETGADRAPPYPTMSIEEALGKALGPRFKLPSHKDCVWFLWVPIPYADQAHELIKYFGFTYKSQHAWVKVRPVKPDSPEVKLDLGTGYWVIEGHENLLVATRGNAIWPAPDAELEYLYIATQGDPVCPAQGENFPSVIFGPRGAEPSEKPEVVARIITQLYPNVPKCELFYRHRKDVEVERARRAWRADAGWEVYGNEADHPSLVDSSSDEGPSLKPSPPWPPRTQAIDLGTQPGRFGGTNPLGGTGVGKLDA